MSTHTRSVKGQSSVAYWLTTINKDRVAIPYTVCGVYMLLSTTAVNFHNTINTAG